MKELKEIILKMLNEIEQKENNLKVRGGKGYGFGTAYPDKTVSVLRNLGYQESEDPEEEYDLKPVKISKVFKKEKK